MTEMVFIVKCKDWYKMFASGGIDTIVYEQRLILLLQEYSIINTTIIYKYKCKNSILIRYRFIRKYIDAGVMDPNFRRGEWFNIKRLVRGEAFGVCVKTHIKKIMEEILHEEF